MSWDRGDPHECLSCLAELMLPRHARLGVLGHLVLLGLHGLLPLRVLLLDLAGVLVVQDQVVLRVVGIRRGLGLILLEVAPQREV